MQITVEYHIPNYSLDGSRHPASRHPYEALINLQDRVVKLNKQSC